MCCESSGMQKFRKHNQSTRPEFPQQIATHHSGQSQLDTSHNVTNLLGIFHHILVGMQSWHWVLEDTASNCVFRTRNLQSEKRISLHKNDALRTQVRS